MTSFSNYFQPQGPGKYIFGIGCELHGEFVNTEEVTHLFIPQYSLEIIIFKINTWTLLNNNRPMRKS